MIKWALKMCNDWRDLRVKSWDVPAQIRSADLNQLYYFTQDDLSFALSRFIREVKKVDGSEYPPNMLKEIIIMIQMYLHKNAITWKLLDHPKFNSLCNAVDNTMKEHIAFVLGVKQSSEIISLLREDKVFQTGAYRKTTLSSYLEWCYI